MPYLLFFISLHFHAACHYADIFHFISPCHAACQLRLRDCHFRHFSPPHFAAIIFAIDARHSSRAFTFIARRCFAAFTPLFTLFARPPADAASCLDSCRRHAAPYAFAVLYALATRCHYADIHFLPLFADISPPPPFAIRLSPSRHCLRHAAPARALLCCPYFSHAHAFTVFRHARYAAAIILHFDAARGTTAADPTLSPLMLTPPAILPRDACLPPRHIIRCAAMPRPLTMPAADAAAIRRYFAFLFFSRLLRFRWRQHACFIRQLILATCHYFRFSLLIFASLCRRFHYA